MLEGSFSNNCIVTRLFLPAGIDYGLMLGQIHALKAHRTTGMANELKEARLRSLNR